MVLVTMQRFLIIILFSAASAEVFDDGPCPEVKPTEDFDFNAFQGIWYEVARYPNVGEGGSKGKCSTAEYTMTTADKGKVKNSHVVDGVKSYIEGDLTILEPGKIMITYTFGAVSKYSYLTVLSTDYKNYAIGYSCRYFEKDNNHQVFSWILIRSKTLKGDVKTRVDNFVRDSKVLDQSKYVYNDHSDDVCKVTVTKPITEFVKT